MNSLKLKAARVGKGLTQEELAKLIKVAMPTYCNKENGKKPFAIKEIKRLVIALNLSVHDADEIFFDGSLSNGLKDKLSTTQETA